MTNDGTIFDHLEKNDDGTVLPTLRNKVALQSVLQQYGNDFGRIKEGIDEASFNALLDMTKSALFDPRNANVLYNTPEDALKASQRADLIDRFDNQYKAECQLSPADKQDPVISEALTIIMSSQRSMPAHFTSSGGRKQSFCVNFPPLTDKDEAEMASAAWYEVDAYAQRIQNLNSPELMYLIRTCEDVMLGTYIVTMLGRENLLPEVRRRILQERDQTPEGISRDDVRRIFMSAAAHDYFTHCADVGRNRARHSKEPLPQ